jgi:methylated-DNA-[protein]-cysteine S-methyltransferase
MTYFSKRVYSLLKQVPEGRVTTYKALANALGTRGYRAIGQILRNNPYAPTVPCHRVITTDGTIGGFMGKKSGAAIKKKRELLQKEGIHIAGRRIMDFETVFFRFNSADIDKLNHEEL